MIVWLASYPRSGNTFLRLIVEIVFGIETYSLHPEHSLSLSADGIEKLKGVTVQSQDIEVIYAAARDSHRLHVMKTHDRPIDDAPAIFIERDGRAACVSYWHFLREFQNVNMSLADVILGRVDSQSWSEHYDAWRPRERSNTLVLQFERLIADPHYVINEIAELLKLDPIGRFESNFDELRREYPKFYRSGSNSVNISELQGDDLNLFWLMHGPLMKSLGYASDTAIPPTAMRELLIDHRKRTEAILEVRFEAIAADRRRIVLQELEAGRAERDAVNKSLEARLYASEGDQLLKEAKLTALADNLSAVTLDRNTKDEVITGLVDELEAVTKDRDAKGEVIAKLVDELEVVYTDHREREKVIANLVAEINELKLRI
jgi:hypothetical protein